MENGKWKMENFQTVEKCEGYKVERLISCHSPDLIGIRNQTALTLSFQNRVRNLFPSPWGERKFS